MKRIADRGKTQSVRAILALIFALSTLGAPGYPAAPATAQTSELVFGALLSLTGEWSSLGIASKAALEIATEDINRELAASGSPARVRVVIEDTRLVPAVALEKLQELARQGLRIIIGPQSSAEVRAVKPYADANGVLIVSQGSTAGALSITGDNVFRLAPDDSHESEALVALLWEDGVRVVVPLGRNDVGNEGLQIATKRLFEGLGGTVVDGLRYEPTAQDYTAEVAATSARVREAQAQHGADVVAVYLTAFEEVVSVFKAAQSDPLLSSARWYGSDGVAGSAALVADSVAAQFAASVGYPNPNVGLDESVRHRWEPLSDQITARTGSQPDALGLAAYDALRIATQALLRAGQGDTPALRDALVQVANAHDGVTGPTQLNEFGDRQLGNYDFWSVRFENGAYRWKVVARYQATPGGRGRVTRELDFPARSLTILGGFPAGGLERFARVIGAEAEAVLGVRVRVENRPGDDGIAALREYQSAPRDGYVLFNQGDTYASAFALGRTDVNPVEDLIPIVHGGIAPSQVYIRSNDPRFSTWEEVVAYAPDHGGLIFGYGAGPLDLEGLTIRNLERAVGVRFHSVAADDGRERYGSILEGRTDLLIEQPGDVRALLESGQIKPILTLWSERIRGFESVPTHYEMGADFTPLLRIRSLAVHRDTPPDRLTVLRRAFQAAFNSEGFQRYLRDDWLDLVRGPLDPIALLAQEIETYRHLYPSILVPEKTVRIGTPPPGSLFFEVGSGMAAVITGHSPMQAGVQPFTGNTAYLEALDAGEIELGVNGAFDFFAAYHRTDPRYTVASDVRVLQRGAAIRAGLLVRDDSAIRDLGGLAGKRVPSGFEPQRVVAALMDANLANAGLSWDDVEAVPVLNTSESIQALAAGWLDVAVGAVGAPEVEAADAAIPGGIRFLSLDTSPDAIARMHEIASFGVGWADAGSAAGARQDTALVSYDIYLTASKDLSDNAAYEIVRALWDFEQELLAKGTQFAGWTRERAADPNAVIPYHPGALRFYRERRAWADSWE